MLPILIGIMNNFAFLASGTRTMILTVVLSALAAWKFPRSEEEEEADA